MTSHRSRLSVLAVVTLVPLACGPATPELATGPNPVIVDACRLFTMEDALAAAGESLAGRMTSTLDDASGRPDPMRCLYNVGSTEDARLVGLEVRSYRTAGAALRAVQGSRSLLRNLTQGQVEEVAGLGEAAVWAGGEIDQLYVAAGEFQLIFTVQTRNGKELERAKEAAGKVIERLAAMKK